jgi:MYXO-CTERM domain-containing protein
MKPKRARSRKSAVITNSRWAAYATAGATSAFTCASSAEAEIHYSGKINQFFDGCVRESATFPLDQPGNFFRLRDSVEFCATNYGGGAYFGVVGQAGAFFAGRYNSACNLFNDLASVSRLHRGDLISNRSFVPGQSGNIALETNDRCGGGYVGQFDGKGVGFIGFKFNNGSGDQYGWVRIQMQKGYNPDQNFRLIDYAYGNVGDPIRAGQKSSAEQTPDQSSLGWLALGAVGLLAWRKNRRAESHHRFQFPGCLLRLGIKKTGQAVGDVPLRQDCHTGLEPVASDGQKIQLLATTREA